MTHKKIIQIGELDIPNWHKIAKAVYSPIGIAPCIHCCGGGNMKPMILVEIGDKNERDKNDRTSLYKRSKQNKKSL